MKNLIMVNSNGVMFGYSLEAIEDITYPKAKNKYNKSDLEGNGINPNDTVIVIRFKSGLESTFNSKCWSMKFE